ncbi:solute carrier family 35 member F4-like [Leptonychotes weddellii]|uniref:Solute carrier family 35 member F4-like n=1 Tax=Leptonychotes weddellii TaxID=9713 RepID=A0A7F8QD95_LEPWE|nr:solute carrier family 35 member F4-like [Leptonychotes weddellii]
MRLSCECFIYSINREIHQGHLEENVFQESLPGRNLFGHQGYLWCFRLFSENPTPYTLGTSRSSVTRCKPGANYPSSHSGISRQLSPLSVTEDSSAPIFELQSRGSSGVCGHRVERQNRSGEDGTQTLPENSSQENRSKARCQSCTSMVLKAVWGLLIILSVSSSWVGTTQIVKITYKNFYCPFFMTWFSTNWNIMFFPVYYSGHLATAQEKQSPMKKFRECSRIFGEDGLTLKLFLKRTAPFSILWTLTNYLYLLALKKLTATDVSALFCCNKAFVFLLSWIVLKDRFMGVRVMAHLIQCVRTPIIVNPWHRESSSVSWNFCQTFPIGSEYKLEFEDALGHPGNYHIMKG